MMNKEELTQYREGLEKQLQETTFGYKRVSQEMKQLKAKIALVNDQIKQLEKPAESSEADKVLKALEG